MHTLSDIMNGNGGNYIAPFLWLHNEDDTLIVRELERIHACGIGAVCIESRTHEEFCREDWWSDVRLILDTCKRLDMKLWILDDKHFPSGYANGIFADKYKHLQPKNIRARCVDFAGPVREGCILADEWKELPDDEFVGAVALRRTDDGTQYDGTAIDLTDGYQNGRFYFDLPVGVWSVAVITATQADIWPDFRLYGDKLDPAATAAYIKEVYEPHYAHFADDFGKTLLGFFSDEPAFYSNKNGVYTTGEPFAAYPWHKNVYDRLAALWGENTLTNLCRLWYDFADGSAAAVREMYMDIITTLYRDNFSKQIGDWCAAHNVMYIGHIIEDVGLHKMLGSGVGHYFRALEGQHMAGVDVVLHQLIPGLCEVANTGFVGYQTMDNKLNHYLLGKLASSAAHIEPQKQGRAMCEVFGAFGWAEDLSFMKYLADHFLVRGINYFVPHAFSPKENDEDCPPNFFNTGKNPQYKYFRLLMDYLNRTSALIAGGKHIATCAVIYDAEASWATKDYCDNKDICKVLYDAQLDYDLIPWDRVDDIDENGNLNGEHYPVIILPYSAHFPADKREKIARLGNRVICVGNKALDGFKHIPLDALVAFMEPHRDVTAQGKYVRYYHYERSGISCYLFSNEDIVDHAVNARLRGFAGGDYVLFDPFANQAVRRHSENGDIPLSLSPNNLLAVLIGENGDFADTPLCCEMPQGEAVDVSPMWDIAVCTERELPHYKHYRTTDKLTSITGRDALCDFTGNMRYTATLPLKKSARTVLDLGEVGSTADVRVNGTPCGTRIFAPYRFDITDAVVDGDNALEIVVTNTCVFEQRDVFSKYMLIRGSGLLGPVRIFNE